ncbi:MAG: hypothetical protein ACXW1T_06160 [Methylophilus sp.]
MAEIATKHQNTLEHHVNQGKVWLAESVEGENTTSISYAAFEFRFGIERLAVHYWATLLGRQPKVEDMKDIESFKRIERRIYELAGHQKEIDGHFEFMRIITSALKINISFHTPQIVKLSSYWRDCSELCHIGWPLSSSAKEVRVAAFTSMSMVASALTEHVNSLGWPIIEDKTFATLRHRFIKGEATPEDILAQLRQTGLYATIEFPDDKPPQFIGEPIPPEI